MLATGMFAKDDEAARVLQELVELRYTAHQLRFAFVVLLDLDAKPTTLYNAFEKHLMKDFFDRGMTPSTAAAELKRCLRLAAAAQDRADALAFLDAPARARSDSEQRAATTTITRHITANASKFVFVHGAAGTGKSTVAQYVHYYTESLGKSCVNVATTGQAALLLPHGATAHSTFKIPLGDEDPLTCNLGLQTAEAARLARASVIQRDEWPGAKRTAWDAVVRYLDTLQKAAPDTYSPKVIVCYGDFRQIPPVLKHASRRDIVAMSVRSSSTWGHFERHRLTTKHRQHADLTYARWIETVGNGTAVAKHSVDGTPGYLELHLCPTILEPREAIDFCFPHPNDANACAKSKILAVTNDTVDAFNDMVLDILAHTYRRDEYHRFSADCIEIDRDDQFIEPHVTPEFLNVQTENGVPPHRIRLIVGALYEIMMNFSSQDRLMNHTQVDLVAVHDNRVDVETLDGRRFPLPRICFRWSLAKGATTIVRRQFPLRPAYASTLNGAQGSTLARCVIDLRRSPFTHGHLYAALSRASIKNALLDTAAAPSSAPVQGQRKPASLYTIAVNVEMIDIPGKKNAGSRVTFADGASLKATQPANRHGLSTLSARAMERWLCKTNASLMPPTAAANPTQGRNWTRVAAAYGQSDAAATKACNYIGQITEHVLTNAFLAADMTVPATPNQTAWSAQAKVLSNRVSLTRTGTKHTSEPYTITELLNVAITIAPNVPAKVHDALKTWASQHGSVVAFTQPVTPSASSSSTPQASVGFAPSKKPATKHPATKTIAKTKAAVRRRPSCK
ncbi:unnamed protein product [Prorocentrum cordatum]|uniref:ATP-dependent DNA helicase n=1 Tax=Prorocentrum cordatum TaxID=2364126 RepID=A0ABN9QGF8_9DINO|nr:unnamed protein product [Polarella glacialis]